MQKPEGRATIATIAKIAGTSKMTVSRVINHKGNVAEKTQERIEQIIKELNYSPNIFARNLVTNKTGIIGLMAGGVLSVSSNFRNTILGVEDEAHKNGYDILFMSSHRHSDIQTRVRPGLVEGMVYFGAHMEMRVIEYFEQKSIPYVIIGKRNWEKYTPDFCTQDYRKGYREATAYLLSLGHKRIAMVGGFLDFEADLEKFEGYWDALKEAGLSKNEDLAVLEDQLSTLEPLLEKRRATALIINGQAAWSHFLELITRKHYRVPKDFSIVVSGLDIDYNAPDIRYLLQIEQLARLELSEFQMGQRAVDCLLQRLSGNAAGPAHHYLTMKFVPGDSCAQLGP